MSFQKNNFMLLVSLMGLAIIPGAMAAEWRVDTGVRVGEVYSDNIRLDGDDEKSEWVTVLSPTVDLEGKGARADVNLKADFEFNSLGGNSDSFNPRIQGDASVELLEDLFFIDADVRSNQTAVNPFSSFGSSNFNESGNRTTTYNYSVSPYLVSRIGSFARVRLRYNYDIQENRGDELDDSTRESASLGFNSGPDFTRFTWGVFGSYSKTDFDDRVGSISPTESSDNEFISAAVRLNYRISRKWQLTSSFGQEWNDFISLDDDIDGDTWSAGIVWTPNKRVDLELGYGERFFGETPTARLSYRHKRSEIQLNYERSVTDSRSLRQQGDIFSGISSFDQLLNVLSRGVLSGSGGFTTPNNSTLVNEQFDFSYSLKGKRTTLTFDARRSEQTAQESNRENVFSGFSVSADRKLSGNLSVNFRYSWDEREDKLLERKSNTDWYTLSFNRQLGPNTNLTFSYDYSDRDGGDFGNGYNGNRLSLYLTVNF